MKDIDTWISDYIGIPYQPHGRTRAGADCWGLVMLVYAEQRQINLDGLINYSFAGQRRDCIASLNGAFAAEHIKWQQVQEAKCFDIVTFSLCGLIYHCGLVIDSKLMLHSENKAAACVEPHNRKDLYAFYRYC